MKAKLRLHNSVFNITSSIYSDVLPLHLIENMSISKNETSNATFLEIPSFQRRLVWSTKQRSDLVDSITKNYPLGSILIWKIEDENKKYLIDGQQRLTSLIEIKKKPFFYMSNQTFFDLLTNDIRNENEIVFLKEEKCKHLLQYLKNVAIDDLQFNSKTAKYDYVVDALKKNDCFNEKSYKNLEEYLLKLNKISTNYRFIDEINVPATTIESSKASLDQIIELYKRINTTGKKLTKFDILTAAWSESKVDLTKTNNFELIKLFKEIKENDVFSRKITLDEKNVDFPTFFIYSMKYIINDFPMLYKTFFKKDTINSSNLEILIFVLRTFSHFWGEKIFNENSKYSLSNCGDENIGKILSEKLNDSENISLFFEKIKSSFNEFEKIFHRKKNLDALKSKNFTIALICHILLKKLHNENYSIEHFDEWIKWEIKYEGYKAGSNNVAYQAIKTLKYFKKR